MFEKASMLYIYAETPLHPGTGTTIRGSIDLPIQRERHTEFPTIQGSSLKGVLRKNASLANLEEEISIQTENGDVKKKLENLVFGGPEGVGGVSVTDARLLAFPVRSLKGVFGWITCPLVLRRFRRDLATVTGEIPKWNIASSPKDNKVIAKENSNLAVNKEGKSYVFIEEMQMEIENSFEEYPEIVEQIQKGLPAIDQDELGDKFSSDLVIVSDEIFRDMVVLTTEVTARIEIGEKGVAKEGALWYEEYLPTDSLLYSLVLIPRIPANISSRKIREKMRGYTDKIIQIGGNKTVGKGFARLKVVDFGGEEGAADP
jgi:CRISPR-associated protein Cmr4